MFGHVGWPSRSKLAAQLSLVDACIVRRREGRNGTVTPLNKSSVRFAWVGESSVTQLEIVVSALGIPGTPVTVTQTASGSGSATYAIDFSGGVSVALLSATVAQGTGTPTTAFLPTGAFLATGGSGSWRAGLWSGHGAAHPGG